MSNNKQMLPDSEIKQIMVSFYPEGTKAPTAEEIIKELRLEYIMRKQVYGNKVLNHKKLSNGWREARKQLAKKLWLIEHAGKIVKERINHDGQADLFNPPEEEPVLISYKWKIGNTTIEDITGDKTHAINLRQSLAQEEYMESDIGSIIDAPYSTGGSAQFVIKSMALLDHSKTDILYHVELEFIGTAG